MAGLTDSGFVRKTLTEILDSIKQGAENEFGPTFNTNDDSVFMQLAGTFSIEIDEVWQGLEGAHSAYTLTGAEGVYLDDLFARHNIIREAKTKGTGVVYIASDNTTVLPEVLDTATVFISNNDTSYELVTDTTTTISNDSMVAYSILSADIVVGTVYTVTIDDLTGTPQDLVFDVALSTDKDDFIIAIKAHINTHNATVDAKTFDFPVDEEIYLGFNANKQLDPLDTAFTFFVSPSIGTRYSPVNVVAQTAGLFPLPSGGISDLTPKFTGFLSVTNVDAFTSGTDVESDAAFRARFNRLIDASAVGCDAESIETALLGVDNVTHVRIYQNPTGTPTAETAIYAFNTVVIGGVAVEIAQKLIDVAPINVSTDGTTTTPITISSGDIINIKHTTGVSLPLNVRITYDTDDDTALTTTEEDAIKVALNVLELNFDIGEKVFNLQLVSSIIGATSYGRFISLLVEVKKVSDGDGSYSNADFVPAFDELPTIADDDVLFVKV